MEFIIHYPAMKGFAKRYSLNAIYVGKCWQARRQDSQKWHELVHVELRRQKVCHGVFKKPVRIAFFWNDKMDCSNHAYIGKMIEDALKGYLIEDDTRKFVHEIKHCFHDKPYIIVRVEEERTLINEDRMD